MNRSRRLDRAWRYTALGIATTGTCYLLFLLLVQASVAAVAANALCYVVGVVLAYVGNRRWAFRSGNRHARDIVRFAAAHAVGFTSSIATIALLIRIMPPALAQVGAIAVAAAAIFTALELFGFARPPAPANGTGRA